MHGRVPVSMFALAVVVRAVVCARTRIPGRDSESYLWMAERIADGDLAAAFGSVFHPLYSLLVAIPLRVFPSLDPVLAGQIVSSGLGALAVFPLYGLTRGLFGPLPAAAASFLYAVGVWFARFPADCMSEGPFYLAVLTTAHLLCAPGPRAAAAAGACAGLAYGLRPEGAALMIVGLPWKLARGERRGCAFAAAGFAAVAIWFPIGWALWGDGFTLTPKAGFNLEQGVASAQGTGLWFYLDNLWRVPLAGFESIGYLAYPLCIAGVVLKWPRSLREPAAFLLGVFLLQCLVIPALRNNIRFVSGYGTLLLPFAGVAWARIAERVRSWPVPAKVALVLVVVAGDLARIPAERRADRVVLRELGLHLRQDIAAGDGVATEMPRLAYYLGLPPLTTRRITREELLEACKSPRTRYAVVVEPRTGVHAAELEALGFAPVELPERLRRLAAERSMLVYEREQ